MDSHPPADSVEDLYCLHCDYNLRGLTSNRCPECGRDFDPITLRQSQIPWQGRSQLGWFRAYWRTARRVMFDSRRFCRETCRPVSFPDAQLFRWVTIMHVWLPPLLLTGGLYATGGRRPAWDPLFVDEFWQPLWPIALGLGCLLLALVAITGAPSWFFHPRHMDVERQNRAVAISCYACAPLALLPVAVVIVLASSLLTYPMIWRGARSPGWFVIVTLGVVAGFAAPLAVATDVWATFVIFYRQTTDRSEVAMAGFAAVLVVLWLLLGALILVGIPLAAGFIALVVASLR